VILSVVLVALTLPMTLAMFLAVVITMTLATVLAMTRAVTPTVPLTVARHVHFVVPAIFLEVDLLFTGIAFAALLAPILRVARRHLEVDRLAYRVHWRSLDHDRLR
jgi:hypothetical protein